MADIELDTEAILGRELTEAEENRLRRLCEFAHALVESSLPGFTITPGTETVDVNVADADVFWTPRYPVTAVNSIEVDGNEVDTAGYQWNQKGRIRFSSYPALDRIDLDWPTNATTVTIDYGYGLDPTPEDVTFTVASMVAAAFRRQTNVDGVQSESLGAYQVSYGDWAIREAAAGMTFPAGALRRWKRNTQVSVPLVRYR